MASQRPRTRPPPESPAPLPPGRVRLFRAVTVVLAWAALKRTHQVDATWEELGDRLAEQVELEGMGAAEVEANGVAMDFMKYRPVSMMLRELPGTASGETFSFNCADVTDFPPERTIIEPETAEPFEGTTRAHLPAPDPTLPFARTLVAPTLTLHDTVPEVMRRPVSE